MPKLTAPEDWSEVREHLLPVLRRVTEPPHAWYVALADPDNRLLRRPIAATSGVVPMLHELVVLDLPDARMFANRGHLRVWGIDEHAVFEAARRNLAAVAGHGLQRRPMYGGLWQVASDDRYEAARLLLPGFLGAFAEQIEGTPLAVAPAGRVLLVGGSDSLDQVATLLDLGERAFRRADSPLSPVLYAPDATGCVAPWVPPADHPLGHRIRAMQRLLAAHEYEAQREQLADNPTIRSHVAEVSLVHPTDGSDSYLLTRWEKGRGDALLPVVDRVVLVDGDAEDEVPWQHIVSHARGCLETTRLHPERYRARWPLPATLDRVRAAG